MQKTIKNHLKKRSISLTLLLGSAISILLLVVNISFIFFVFNDMQIYSTLINDTGKVRGGSQRLIKNELAHVNSDSQIAELNRVLSQINAIQNEINIKFSNAGDYGDKLEALIIQWQQINTELRQYRAGTLSADQLLDASERLWYVADQAVSSVEQAAHFDILLYYIISIVSTITVILFIGAVLAMRIFIRDRAEYDIEHDPLTGLYNRYYLSQVIEQEILLARQLDMPVYLLLCDIDHFRAINDTYGYEMGDRVIKSVARLLKHQIRSPDLAVRLGGEAFILLIHSQNVQEALSFANRIKDCVEHLHIHEGLNLTLSVGISRYSKGVVWDEALKSADLALYEAKHTGRNAICVRNV